MWWFDEIKIKGGNAFKVVLALYFALEFAYAIIWFAFKMHINIHMTPAEFVGTRFISDFNNIGNRFGVPGIMTILTHWLHEPSWIALIPLLGYLFYDIGLLYETLRFRHVTGILPPSYAGKMQITIVSLGLACTAIAFVWSLIYLFRQYNETDTKKKTKRVRSREDDYLLMKN